VTFDPRGAAQGIRCMGFGLQEHYWETNLIPRTSAELNDRVALEQQVNQGLYSRTTIRSRDTSTVRARCATWSNSAAAMGLTQFNYMGRSYGTFLGYRYAKLYPAGCAQWCSTPQSTAACPTPQSFTENAAVSDTMWQKYKEWCKVASTPVHDARSRYRRSIQPDVGASARQPAARARALFTQRPVNDWILVFHRAGVRAARRHHLQFRRSARVRVQPRRRLGGPLFLRLRDRSRRTKRELQAGRPGESGHHLRRYAMVADSTQPPRICSSCCSRRKLRRRASASRRWDKELTNCIGYPVDAVEPTPLSVQLTGVPPCRRHRRYARRQHAVRVVVPHRVADPGKPLHQANRLRSRQL
jgi:pimeloyl-ACP methyl ester carboxylesterase